MENLGIAMVVWVGLAIPLIIPPLVVAWRLTPAKSVWLMVLTALALGCASQGLFGLFWDRLVLAHPLGEISLYYGFWVIASLIALRVPRIREVGIPLSRGECWLLGLTLLAAIGIRAFHPLAHAALGQSDAYSHLQFIRQVMADGMIHNQIYPPGFSWIMALPAMTFRMDPYWIARFGGAFWGAGLTLALYALGRFSGRHWTGLIMAGLAAFCPFWMPLLKTGVGVFANQSGLFFLPLILLAYMQSGQQKAFWLLLILSMALISAVPMMWISLMPVLLIDRGLAGVVRESRWWQRSALLALALLPAFTLLIWQSSRIQDKHLKATMVIVTGEEVSTSPSSGDSLMSEPESLSASRLLIQNYFLVKRWGYGNLPLNRVASGLGFAFAFTLFLGLRKRDPSLRLLGIWGFVTSIQAATGFMQFSGYQREGWSLLMATAWLGGVMGAGVLAFDGRRGWLKNTTLGLFLVFFIWTCRFPPRHVQSFSAAEDELIDVARLAAHRVRQNHEELPLTLVMRRFTEFHGNQGDPLEAVVGPFGRVETIAVGTKQLHPYPMNLERQYLFLMDRVPLTEGWNPGVFAQVQPHQVEQFIAAQNRLFHLNQKVEIWLDALSVNQWTRESIVLGPKLDAILVRPIAGVP